MQEVNGFTDWRTLWDEDKKRYCCLHAGKGCPEPHVKYVPKVVYHDKSIPFPVKVRVRVPVPRVVTKQVVVQEPLPYTCDEDSPMDAWSSRHLRYCCYLKQLGCRPQIINHNVYHKVVKIKKVKVPHYLPPKRTPEAHIKYKTVPYPVPDVPKVQTVAVPGKVIIKTRYVEVPKMVHVPAPGDVEVVRKPVAVQVASKPIYVKMPPTYHHHGHYDCNAGYSNWYFGWSEVKKTWCCDHEDKGCPGTWHGSLHLHHVHISHDVGVATGKIYDCDAGFSNWLQGWSDSKKKWCCSHKDKGCPKYYCNGQSHHWSAHKQQWCCTNFQKGCARTTLSPLGCEAPCTLHGDTSTCKSRMQWTRGHVFSGEPNACSLAYSKVQVECDVCRACSIEEAGCDIHVATSAAFDCDAAFNNFFRAWSPAKKQWCCTVKHKGCEGDSPPNVDAGFGMVWKRVQVNGYWVWVAVHAGGMSLPYDCHAGLVHHLTGWSQGKKAWCCQHQHLGCAAATVTHVTHETHMIHSGQGQGHAGMSHSHGNPPGVAAHGMIWQWNHHWIQVHAGGSLPFDCSAGLSKWQSGWSAPKKQWCCQHVGVACV